MMLTQTYSISKVKILIGTSKRKRRMATYLTNSKSTRKFI